MEKLQFAKKDIYSRLDLAHSFRYEDAPVPTQLDDCILDGVNNEHPRALTISPL